MGETIPCKICGKRKAQRACPAVEGDICSICCGTHREINYSCPLSCEYLQEAHRREKPIAIAEKDLANMDIQVTEEFVRDHEEFLLFCVYALVQSSLRTPGAVDTDLLAALDALIKTQKTLASGLFYETRAENSIAAAIQRSFSASLKDYQTLREERERLLPLRDSEVLATLAFLHRLGQQNLNGRPRGRMYLGLLHQMTPDGGVEETRSSIIL